MSRFHKLSHAKWHCQYHLVWVPKYRYRILQGAVGQEVSTCLQVFAQQKGCKVIELNVQVDHVHLLALVPPKVSISELVGTLKGRSAIRVFKQFPHLKLKPYWGNHFWARGYSWLLCGYGRFGCGDDPQVCQVSRSKRTS